jgi:hypothetical protein
MLETAEIKPNFSNNALLDATLIFQTVLMDKIHDNMQESCFTQNDQLKMAESAGNELRKLIHTYTGLDTHELVKNYE